MTATRKTVLGMTVGVLLTGGLAALLVAVEMREQLQLESGTTGVVVTRVQPGSLAQSAGIRAGDLIVAVGAMAVADLQDFRAALNEADLDQGVRMRVQREGTQRFVYLKRRS
jgi:serine protease Do